MPTKQSETPAAEALPLFFKKLWDTSNTFSLRDLAFCHAIKIRRYTVVQQARTVSQRAAPGCAARQKRVQYFTRGEHGLRLCTVRFLHISDNRDDRSELQLSAHRTGCCTSHGCRRCAHCGRFLRCRSGSKSSATRNAKGWRMGVLVVPDVPNVLEEDCRADTAACAK